MLLRIGAAFLLAAASTVHAQQSLPEAKLKELKEPAPPLPWR